MYIGGSFTSSASGEFEAVINPATEEVIGEAPVGTLADADQALAAAHESFASGVWRSLKPAQRIERMWAFHDALERRKEQIGGRFN